MSTQKSVLITGASSGIGRDACKALGDKGFFVIGTVRNEEDAKDLQSEGPNVHAIILDVCDEPAIRRSLGEVQRLLGGRQLDALVNNAGFFEFAPIETMTIETHRKIIDTNYFGTVNMVQTYLPMLRASKGRIVNIASVNGEFAFPFTGAYGASKFALEALSDALRRELDYFGVKVVVIEPSFTMTVGKDKVEQQMNATLEQDKGLYPHFKQFRDTILTGFATAGDPVEKVTSYIVSAIEDESPSARYAVGATGSLMQKIASHLPTYLTDLLVKASVFHGYVDVKPPTSQ